MANSIILTDTREQLQLPFPRYIRKKLIVGDYSTTILENKFHIERKSSADLFQTLTKGHTRFRKEVLKAKEKNIILHVMVEDTEFNFLQKRFRGAEMIKGKTEPIVKALKTMSEKYSFTYEFCMDRQDMMERIEKLFYDKEKELNL